MNVFKFWVYACQKCKLARVLQPMKLFPHAFRCLNCNYDNRLTDRDKLTPMLIRSPVIATNDYEKAKASKISWNKKIQDSKERIG